MTTPTTVAISTPVIPAQITKKMLQTLAPLPATAVQLLSLLDDPNASLRQIADVASRDVGIAAAILRMANSPVLGMRGRVGTIGDALRLIGTVQARLLVLACGVAQAGQKELPLYGLVAGAFVRHSELAATLSLTIARQTRCAEVGVAYSAGLLHDIGKVVANGLAIQAEPTQPRRHQFAALMAEPHATLVTAERRMFGTDHPSLGRDLALLWGLPQEIGEAILLHHTDLDGSQPTLPPIIALANAIAAEVDPSYPASNRAPLPEHSPVAVEPLLALAREMLE